MILIIQNGFLGTNVEKYLDEEYHLIKSYESNLERINLELYSTVIVLGGHQSVQNIKIHPSLMGVTNLIKECYASSKPVVGICLGCQLIGHAMGCEIVSSPHYIVGYDTTIEIEGEVFDGVFRSHGDYIKTVTDDVEVLSTVDSMPYLIKAGTLIGIQCHPDIPPEYINRYVNVPHVHKNKKYTDDDIDATNQRLISKLIEMARR